MGQGTGKLIGSARQRAAAFLAVVALTVIQPAPSQTTPAPAAAETPAVPAAATIAPPTAAPIAVISLAGKSGAQAPTVTGALEVTADKAIIAASGAVTAGDSTTDVTLPNRGSLLVCPRTTVKLAADSSVPAAGLPGLLMALDRGALEATLKTGPNADVVLTPDFRILIAGPGTADFKLRLAANGDTCVDNPGANAPYVVVTSLFQGGVYRVQPGQRVLFEHGSLSTVVDNEKEPCGCPAPEKGTNPFPVAQSEGLAPLAKPIAPASGAPAPATAPLVYNSAAHQPKPAPVTQPPVASAAPAAAAPPTQPAARKKPNLFVRIGRFFKRLFGAE